MHIGLHFTRIVPKGQIVELHGKHMFNFIKTNQKFFKVTIILHSHQWCLRIPPAVYPTQYLLLTFSLILTILIVVWWFLTMI